MAFVVSSGQLTAVERPAPLPAARVQIASGLSMDYAAIWRAQPAVRMVVSFLARNVADLGLHVYRRASDTDRQRLVDHPLARLLKRPNPKTTWYRFAEALVSDLGIYDNAIIVKVRADDGSPGALWRIPPQMVTPQGNWLEITHYTIRGSRGAEDVAAEDVVHLRGYNPGDPRWGCSPIETLRTILAEEYAAAQYRAQLWRNGARASGYIKRPDGAAKWSDQARSRFQAEWRSQYLGEGATEAGGTPILEDGMDWVPASTTAREAQYVESRKLTREEVAAAYHVPPPMVGILDHATFSNITEQHKNLYQDTLGPLLDMIAQDVMLQLLPEFPGSEDVYVEFNLAEKLAGTFEEQAAVLQTATGAPYMLRSEARARLNLPEVPGMDEPIVPLNVLVGGQASPTDSAPDLVAPPKAGAGRPQVKARADSYEQQFVKVLERFFGRQASAVLSALGAGSPLTDAWDRERWVKELAADLFRVNTVTAEAAAKAALEQLGLDPDGYDVDRTFAWLLANAKGVAEGVNDTTYEQLAAAEADDEDSTAAMAAVFETAKGARAAQIAVAQTSAVSGFGTVEAVKQQGARAVKTWHAGHNPRSKHARMDGETVAYTATFSNGARWPGDSRLDADERAGCNCRMTIALED